MNSKKFLLSSLIAIALGASNNMVSWGAETGIEYVQGGEKTRASGLTKILNLEKHGAGVETNSIIKLLCNSKKYIENAEPDSSAAGKSFTEAYKSEGEIRKLAEALNTFSYVEIDETAFSKKEDITAGGAETMRALWAAAKGVFDAYVALANTPDEATLRLLCKMIIGDGKEISGKDAGEAEIEEVREYVFGTKMQEALYNASSLLDIDGLYDDNHFKYDDGVHTLKSQTGTTEQIHGNYRVESVNGITGNIITKVMKLAANELDGKVGSRTLGSLGISDELYDLINKMKNELAGLKKRYDEETMIAKSSERAALREAVNDVENLIKKHITTLSGVKNQANTLFSMQKDKTNGTAAKDLMGLTRLSIAEVSENMPALGATHPVIDKTVKKMSVSDAISLFKATDHKDMVDTTSVPLNKVSGSTKEAAQTALNEAIDGLGLALTPTEAEVEDLFTKSCLETEREYLEGAEFDYTNEELVLDQNTVTKLKGNVTRKLSEVVADTKYDGRGTFVHNILTQAYGESVDEESDVVPALLNAISISVNNSSKTISDDLVAAGVQGLKDYLKNTGVNSKLFKLEGDLLTDIAKTVEGATPEAVKELFTKSPRSIQGTLDSGLAALFASKLTNEEKENLAKETLAFTTESHVVSEKYLPQQLWKLVEGKSIKVKRGATEEEKALETFKLILSDPDVDLRSAITLDTSKLSAELKKGLESATADTDIEKINEAYSDALEEAATATDLANERSEEIEALTKSLEDAKTENNRLTEELEKQKKLADAEIEKLKKEIEALKESASKAASTEPKKEELGGEYTPPTPDEKDESVKDPLEAPSASSTTVETLSEKDKSLLTQIATCKSAVELNEKVKGTTLQRQVCELLGVEHKKGKAFTEEESTKVIEAAKKVLETKE